MKIIRVFPRRTNQTPDDDMAFVGDPGLFLPEADEVHVSVTFTWDKSEGERLVAAWGKHYGNIKIGGPAYGDPGHTFTAGMYVKHGVTFTSRGCPNRCWYCFVPKREGPLREFKPIVPGHIVQDNNLLACSQAHFDAVCEMLSSQRAIELSGGLEARRLTAWHANRLRALSMLQVFLAYDKPSQRDDARRAIDLLRTVGFSQRQARCFVLMGFPGDTLQAANQRATDVLLWGGCPYAMYYQDGDGIGRPEPEWHDLVREYSRPAAMADRMEPFLEADEECEVQPNLPGVCPEK